MLRRFPLALSLALLLAAATAPPAAAGNGDVVKDLPACNAGDVWELYLAFESSDTDCTDDLTNAGSTVAKCCCANGSIYSCKGDGGGGGGSGDITDVWGCTSGNCNAITGASGDSLDASNADSSIPWTLGTSSFPTTEGRGKWDSSGDRLGIGNGTKTSWLYPGTRAASTTDGGPATTATALAANGGNCTAASSYAIGIDASGAGECSSSPLTINAPYGQYDPWKPPSTCATCDEFTNDTASLTWSCNGGTITQTYTHDRMRLEKANSGSGQDLAMCSVAAPSGSFTITAHISPLLYRNTNQCAIGVIRSGTQASPTSLTYCGVYTGATAGTTSLRLFNSATSYTTGASSIKAAAAIATSVPEPMWFQLRYDASADTIVCASSWDGVLWHFEGLQSSVTSDPTYAGFIIDDQAAGAAPSDSACEFPMLRIRTDADRNDASD